MAGFEVNGVGSTQGTGASYEVKKQDAKEEYINSSFGQGYGAASGEGQVDKPATGVINAYGGDIANFAKFKGNDKNDAMRLTNSAAKDVKKQYMQLQHEFPGLELQFEPMPNPQTAGKRREGFFNYQQQLDDWKDNAMTQINNARERNTVEVVGDAVVAVNQNTDEKAVMNAALTTGYGEANLEATEQEGAETRKTVKADGAKTRKAVHAEGAATRKTVRAEGAKTRDVVRVESAVTRNVVRTEGAKTRNTVREVGTDIINEVHEESTTTRETVRQVGKDTQETTTLSDKVSDNLNNYPHTSATKKAVGDIRDKIVSSNLTAEEKKEMLDDLAGWSGQAYIGDKELEAKQKEVNDRLAFGEQEQPEVSKYDLPPLKEVPVYEDPYANTETKNPPKISAGYNKPIRKNPFIKGDTPKAIDNGGGTSTAPAETKKSHKTDEKGVPYAPDPEPSILDKKPFWKK